MVNAPVIGNETKDVPEIPEIALQEEEKPNKETSVITLVGLVDNPAYKPTMDDADKYNPTLLWSTEYENVNGTYMFSETSIFTIDKNDQIYANSYDHALITSIDGSLYTFLSERNLKDTQKTPGQNRQDRTFGNELSGDKIVLEQTCLRDKPYIRTIDFPLHLMYANESNRKVEFTPDYNLTLKLVQAEMDYLRNPEESSDGRNGVNLRSFSHYFFQKAQVEHFQSIDREKLPDALKGYKTFKIGE